MHFSVRTAAVLLALGLAGCGSSRAVSTGATTAASTASATTVVTPSTTASASGAAPPSVATTAPSASTAPTTTAAWTSSVAPDFPSLKDCIVRRWLLVADQADNVFDGSAMQRLPGFTQVTTGEGPIEFRADGTYTYTPNFAVEITLNGVTGQGVWSGTLQGTWSATDTTLAMTPTTNGLRGTLTLFGSTQPLPPIRAFDGQARVVSCKPETFSYELAAPSGAFTTTLVGA